MIKLLTVIGARPQFIKSLALSRAIREGYGKYMCEVLLHTGQHYDEQLSGVFFSELQIREPDYNLGVGSSAHGEQTAEMIRGIENVIFREKPSAVVVYGDTNSTLAGALAGSKQHIPVAHIEAGLRSFNKNMPEEINRVLTDHVSAFLFAPTQAAVKNLVHEGFGMDDAGPYHADHPGLFHCGDVMYDNCLYYKDKAETGSDIIERLGLASGEFLLATVHRNYNTDDLQRLQVIMTALEQIAKEEKIPVVLPLHPRTRNAVDSDAALKVLVAGRDPGLVIIPPVSYFEMLRLERHASMILTDSGGVQKEAYFHCSKCLTLRTETEWTELLEHGMLRLAGSTADDILKEYYTLKSMSFDDYPPVYGDGKAAEFICRTLKENL